MNSGNPSDLGANLVVDHVDTDDCQARVLSRELSENNTCQACSNTDLSELEQQAQQEHACLGRQAPDRHRTGVMVQAKQHLLRRAAVTLHVEECGWEENQSATQIQKQVARLEQS